MLFVTGCGSSGGMTEAANGQVATMTNTPLTATGATPAAAQLDIVDGSLCQPGETIWFSCAVGAKRVSVCRGGTGAVYRHGMPGRVELTVRDLSTARTGYSGGGEAQVTATNGGHSYTVFDRTIRTGFDGNGNAPAFSNGLLVRRGDRIVLNKECTDESSINLDATDALPAGSFVEH